MALAALGACADTPTGASPDVPPAPARLAVAASAATSAATSATSPFGWLAPLGTASAEPSTFDANAAPVVEICAWTGTACASEPIVRFAIAPVAPTRPLVVNATGGWYEASWDLMDVRLTTRRTYRVQVRRGTAAVGAVLVDAVRGRWALTQSGTLAPLQAASALPIRFRIDLPPADGPITPEQRVALVRAAADEATRLDRLGRRGAAFATPMLTWVRARAGFEASGTSVTGGVWARFRDGRLLVIENPHANFARSTATAAAQGDAAPGAAAASAPSAMLAAHGTISLAAPAAVAGPAMAPAPADLPWGPRHASTAGPARAAAAAPAVAAAGPSASELPWSRKARLFHTFGTDPGVRAQIQAPIDQMTTWLADADYLPTRMPEGDVSVEALRAMQGDGFVQVNAHGDKGVLRGGDTLYVMSTSTRVGVTTDVGYADDLNNRRLAYFVGDMGGTAHEGVYAITPEFVRTYVGFAEHAVVFLNVCWSAHQTSDAASGPRAFVAALHAKGASVVFGWTRAVDVTHAMRAVRYFVDRTLGSNQFEPVAGPLQRPFDWQAVIAEMRRTGRARDANGAELLPMPRPAATRNAGFLVPSIEGVAVCTRTAVETCQVPGQAPSDLYIRGTFGPDPGPSLRTVTIRDGGTARELTVVHWDSTVIFARIPLTGVGSVGDVRVQTRGRLSNPRRVYAWNGTLAYSVAWVGSLKQEVTVGLRLRTDPLWGRAVPDEAPHDLAMVTPGISLLSPQPSELRWTASGRHVAYTENCETTVTWNGSGALPIGAGTVGAGGPSFFWYNGVASVDRRELRVGFQFLIDEAYTQTIHEVCVYPTYRTERTDVTKEPIALSRAFDARPADPSQLLDLHFGLDDQMGLRGRTLTATPELGEYGVPPLAALRLQWSTIPTTPEWAPRLPR